MKVILNLSKIEKQYQKWSDLLDKADNETEFKIADREYKKLSEMFDSKDDFKIYFEAKTRETKLKT